MRFLFLCVAQTFYYHTGERTLSKHLVRKKSPPFATDIVDKVFGGGRLLSARSCVFVCVYVLIEVCCWLLNEGLREPQRVRDRGVNEGPAARAPIQVDFATICRVNVHK